MKRFLILLCALACTAANAEQAQQVSPDLGDETFQRLSQVAQAWPVAENWRDDQFLRVSFVTVGPWQGSDVSPPYTLYLTMHASHGEWGGESYGQWRISGVFNASTPVRLAPGVYEIEVHDLGGSDCFSRRSTFTIDAAEASVYARQNLPQEEMGQRLIDAPIFVSHRVEECGLPLDFYTDR